MELIVIFLQVAIAAGLINVWLLRNSKSTDFRGQDAKSLKEEFHAYGLPDFMYYLVGFLKLSSAAALLAALIYPVLSLPAALVVAFLMLGALTMHIKVKDPIKKSLPALGMLAMSLALIAIRFL